MPTFGILRHPSPAGTLGALALGLAVALPAAATPEPAPAEVRERMTLPGVHGRVTGEVEPLSAARVYAYQLADFSLLEVRTNDQGRFRFSELPAGLYKIIAHKPGFVPAVVMLTRARSDTRQFLELQLAAEEAGEPAAGEDFWSVRDRIPADVLREITKPEAPGGLRLADSPFARDAAEPVAGFATQMEAMTGVEKLPSMGEALVTGGQVGLEGRMGSVRVGLSGDYWRLGPSGAEVSDAQGQMRQIALKLEGGAARVALSTHSQRLVGSDDEPVDFEAHRLSWSQGIGETGRAHLAAGYTAQSNLYRHSPVSPLEIPRDSSSWEVEGSYTLAATQRTSFQAGVRYRDRRVAVAMPDGFGDGDPALHEERLDLFGRSGTRVRPAVLVEYGLYTTLRDGSVSFTPQGGLVLQLGDDWQASTLMSHKVTTDQQPGPRDFIPAFYHESSACTQGEESCVKVLLSRDGESTDLSVGAVHRRIGETLRLFFNEDFFNHLESLYLVRGDELPELQLGVTRRLTPQLLARIESNVGSGGGGIFYASDRTQYENSVRYLVTSLDTHYQGTATGLFIAFHHLEQELEVLGGPHDRSAGQDSARMPRLELQRLQLMLTQDLNILLDLAADWAVKLNMEVSRGSVLSAADPAADDELRRRILGGFAVKF
ncbi:MAG TPA: carboxypeptidase-like regulatory domain-containing protein [Thermoanaerobaculia bacterium]|nr:carboxypeptidase-like regulatory domain-containing protein [Thermoanaerobaculia bacterium]